MILAFSIFAGFGLVSFRAHNIGLDFDSWNPPE